VKRISALFTPKAQRRAQRGPAQAQRQQARAASEEAARIRAERDSGSSLLSRGGRRALAWGGRESGLSNTLA